MGQAEDRDRNRGKPNGNDRRPAVLLDAGRIASTSSTHRKSDQPMILGLPEILLCWLLARDRKLAVDKLW